MNGSIDGHTSTSRKAAETAGCVSQRKSVIVQEFNAAPPAIWPPKNKLA
jgi:hypothetical protein